MLLLRRNLGTTPREGEWVSEPRIHRTRQMISVDVGCPLCGLVQALDCARIQKDGTVTYVWTCTGCPARDFVKLDGWGDAQWDTSDVERSS
ncbi:MAG: hypothetical protein AB7E70_19455 [Hyphomicrobiaceae bacterium]